MLGRSMAGHFYSGFLLSVMMLVSFVCADANAQVVPWGRNTSPSTNAASPSVSRVSSARRVPVPHSGFQDLVGAGEDDQDAVKDTEAFDESEEPDTDKAEAEDDSLDGEDDYLDEEDESNPPERPPTTWNLKPMSALAAGLRTHGLREPADQSFQLTGRPVPVRAASEKVFAWAAPGIRYQPLFFEDVALERYGQTKGYVRQPVASAIHFMKSGIFLPYNSLLDPIDSCEYPLGYCRPGDSVPCVRQRVVLRPDATHYAEQP